ncbi:MAG: MarC family protein [Thiohalocapsa sp.]|jgi:multiple antibiotic resistance protein|uniref:MarC family protein n=1 Tax=Thiohalocapsa sp. TaxID=2497641 RepID=UPI0025EE61B1|nr:MarC family protein [Thiohalocapsa sp.]MCG6940605.1 MarC family protein [Thiohalocapsa sp.]
MHSFVFDKAFIGQGLSVFMGFFAIMNPIANTPVFLGLTAGDDAATRRRVAFQAVLAAFVIVLVFCLLGSVIFKMFGITLPAFRITGGVLVALIGFQMLHSNHSAVHHPSDADQADSRQAALSVALTPLALPILAGPGTIATAMNFASTGGTPELLLTVGAFALLCLITYIFFVFGEGLTRFLGKSGLAVITRIMGLILAVIGVQMLVDGIRGAFPVVA